MRWNRTENGETRIIKKFAYLPVLIGKHEYWLETYKVYETFRSSTRRGWCLSAITARDDREVF